MRDKNQIFKNTLSTESETGSAMVITILVMMLLMGFVALAISRTTSEMIISGNDASESRSFGASEASVENTTRDLVDIFERKLTPDNNDILTVKQKAVPGFDKFSFTKEITKTKSSVPVVLTGGTYNGLYALRDSWEISSIATEINSDVKVQLKRRFFSDRVPIFQFGIFYDDDLELNRPPLFTFGGRVHTNGNLFFTAAAPYGIYFNSRVTASKQIVNDVWKPGITLTTGYDDQGKVFVNDASGTPQELVTGEASVTCKDLLGVINVTNAPISDLLSTCSKNPNWNTQKAKFQGNLENEVPKLNLPLSKLDVDLIEIIRRGKNIGDVQNLNGVLTPVTDATKDTDVFVKERFTNKTGFRISLADSQAKLPGCATVAVGSNCGVRLDDTLGANSIGYQPVTMSDGYKATAFNATRVAMNGREVWIKVEMVDFTYNNSLPQTTDVTQDILSLGITEPAPIGDNLQINNYNSTTDSRSIIKLQRFSVPGPSIPEGGTTYLSNYTINSTSQNLAVRYRNVATDPSTGCSGCTAVNSFSAPVPEPSALGTMTKEDAIHLKWANLNNAGNSFAIVPFPIEIFDSREGLPNDDATEANTNFGTTNVPSAGVMSLVDIDVANLRRFLSGSFDGMFPQGTPYFVAKAKTLRSADVPNSNGWVVYFSDRRGDYDFDGEYDMEDVFPDNSLQFNEDINKNGILDKDYGREAAAYSTSVPSGQAATSDHLYYRRGVRLINGSTLPGNYDAATPENTKGFTFASENAVYVKGNYNVTGVGVSNSNNVTPPENYSPQNTANHIPAAIVSDAVIILSNNWKDGESFATPFSSTSRPASNTAVRFAMISGDPVTGNNTFYSPSQFGQLNGGVHNFKRFLEDWQTGGNRLNYSGSLINLFNSHNNNGFLKCCTTTYKPPTRDWTFDISFLNANRLPPGTPYIYSISFTGFQRVND
jgi:Tfp pilus assembly protein PilX